MVTLLTRLDWLKRYRTQPCPIHGKPIADSVVAKTAWCPICERVWWITRDRITWKAAWGYELHHGSE